VLQVSAMQATFLQGYESSFLTSKVSVTHLRKPNARCVQ